MIREPYIVYEVASLDCRILRWVERSTSGCYVAFASAPSLFAAQKIVDALNRDSEL